MARAVMLVVGVSHQTAALSARERAALDDGGSRAVLRRLRADGSVREAAVLSTCNRTEIYAVADSAPEGEQAVRRVLLERTRLGAATLSCTGYALFEGDAVEHLFRVAAGLESAILGETEIAGQVRLAARRARQEGALGPLLSGAFDRAVGAARRARRQTAIGAGATSVASVVVEAVAAACPGMPGPRVVLVGAGRLAQSVAGALAAVPSAELVVANRTHAAARDLARRHRAAAIGLDGLEAALPGADVLVCATDAPDPILSADAVARAVTAAARPLLIIDLAVPRDVEPAARGVAGVTLHDIDTVQRRVDRNLAARRREAEAAARIVRREAERFETWRRELDAVPVVRSVWRRAEQLRREALAGVERGLSDEERDRLERVTGSLVRKLLDGPCERLRAACATADGAAHIESLRVLFDADADGQRGEAPPANVIALPTRGAA